MAWRGDRKKGGSDKRPNPIEKRGGIGRWQRNTSVATLACFFVTHVAGTQDRSGKGSEGSWEGNPFVRCSGKPYHRQGHRIGWEPGHRQAGSR
jgi:hypothetical protein